MPPVLPARIRQGAFLLALLLTVAGLAVPVLVPASGSYSITYVGVDFDADEIHDTAALRGQLDEETTSLLDDARERGTTSIRADHPLVDGRNEDFRLSVVGDDRVYQYRVTYTPEDPWRQYHDETALAGFAGMLAVVVYGTAQRRWETPDA